MTSARYRPGVALATAAAIPSHLYYAIYGALPAPVDTYAKLLNAALLAASAAPIYALARTRLSEGEAAVRWGGAGVATLAVLLAAPFFGYAFKPAAIDVALGAPQSIPGDVRMLVMTPRVGLADRVPAVRDAALAIVGLP